MTGELVKFGVVMLVVILGFVMSFYSLFSEDQTYGEVSDGAFCKSCGVQLS